MVGGSKSTFLAYSEMHERHGIIYLESPIQDDQNFSVLIDDSTIYYSYEYVGLPLNV